MVRKSTHPTPRMHIRINLKTDERTDENDGTDERTDGRTDEDDATDDGTDGRTEDEDGDGTDEVEERHS